jgi:hypothetical protein
VWQLLQDPVVTGEDINFVDVAPVTAGYKPAVKTTLPEV